MYAKHLEGPVSKPACFMVLQHQIKRTTVILYFFFFSCYTHASWHSDNDNTAFQSLDQVREKKSNT